MDDEEYMLTTKDNPWNPFTQWDEWYAWDVSHGYDTCRYLAAIAVDSPELSPAQNNRAINDAIDEIIDFNLTGNRVKVCRKDYEDGKWIANDSTTNGATPINE